MDNNLTSSKFYAIKHIESQKYMPTIITERCNGGRWDPTNLDKYEGFPPRLFTSYKLAKIAASIWSSDVKELGYYNEDMLLPGNKTLDPKTEEWLKDKIGKRIEEIEIVEIELKEISL